MFWRHVKRIGMQQMLQVYLIRVRHSHVILCPTDCPEGYAHNLSARSLMASGFRILSSATCKSFLQRVAKAFKRREHRTLLVVQWLRSHLPMQGTWIGSLVQEDPTCHRATNPTCHNCWAHVPRSPCSAMRSHHDEKPHAPRLESSPCSLLLEKAHEQQRKPSAAPAPPPKKKKQLLLFFKKTAYLL